MSNASTKTTHQLLGPLPAEIFLNVLDQLVETGDGSCPLPQPQLNSVRKTLRSLTLVSRDIYPIATKYLYSAHIWLGSLGAISRFCTTLELNRQRHTLTNDMAVQQHKGFAQFDLSKYVTSLYLSPVEYSKSTSTGPRWRWTPNSGLTEIVGLCHSLSSTLKRLHLNLLPMVAHFDATKKSGLETIDPNLFARLLRVEEMMITEDVIDYFTHPPPNLKRLGIIFDVLSDFDPAFCLSLPSLRTLVLLRPWGFSASMIETFLDSYHGKNLDIILFENSVNYGTSEGTREWRSDDTVHIFEADVPLGFYGDDVNDEWMWDQAIEGTLWSQTQRQMKSWADIRKPLPTAFDPDWYAI